jgi:hypothetical protein
MALTRQIAERNNYVIICLQKDLAETMFINLFGPRAGKW